MKYTVEQLQDFARRVILADAADPDFVGVGEQFEDEWADLPEDEFDKVRLAVHDLACAATITVTWPDSITEEERLAEILWDARKAVLKTGERLPFEDVSEQIRGQYRQYAGEVAKRLDPDRADELERIRAELAKRCSCDGDPIECSHEAARGEAEAERDAARTEAGQLRARLDAAWAVEREGTANMRAQLATVRAERDKARTEAARHLEHLRQAHPRHFTPNVLGERLCGCDGQWPCREHVRAAEQLERARDLKRIRLAISDPGAFVKRKRFNDGAYETVPAWGARAVHLALFGEEVPSDE